MREGYRVDDLPPGKAGAFTPVPAGGKIGRTWGAVDVWGAPGNRAVPSPSPNSSLPSRTAQAKGPNTARPSDHAPDVIMPILYVASPANMGPSADLGLGMARRRRNELPVPAQNPTRLAAARKLIVAKGRRSTLPWPGAFQRYPTQG